MRKALKTLFPFVIVAGLFGCGNQSNLDSIVSRTDPITQSEVDGVFDLGELGKKTYDEAGNMFLGGRPVEATNLASKSYGRTYNFLGLSPEVLDEMEPSARSSALAATPAQLRTLLGANGLKMADIRAAQTNGMIEAQGVRKLFNLSAQRIGKSNTAQTMGISSIVEGK
jgi:hypothetical protein